MRALLVLRLKGIRRSLVHRVVVRGTCARARPRRSPLTVL